MSDVIPPGLELVKDDDIPPGLEAVPPGLELVKPEPDFMETLPKAAETLLQSFGLSPNVNAMAERNKRQAAEFDARRQFLSTLDKAMRDRDPDTIDEELYEKFGQFMGSKQELADRRALAELREKLYPDLPADQLMTLEPLISEREANKGFTTSWEEFKGKAGEMLDYWGSSASLIQLREKRGELGYQLFLGQGSTPKNWRARTSTNIALPSAVTGEEPADTSEWGEIETSDLYNQVIELDEQMRQITDKHKGKNMGWLADAIYEAIQIGGQMLYGAAEGGPKGAVLAGGFAGAAALGGLPLQAAPGPGTVAHASSIAAAAAGGFGLGMSQGMLEHIARQEIGNTFLGLMEVTDENGNRISPELARAGTAGYAFIATAIEAFSLSHLPGVSEGFNKVMKTGFGQWLKKASTTGPMKNRLLRVAAKYGMNLSAQVLEEVAQEASQFGIEEFIKWGENEFRGTDFADDWDEFLPTLGVIASKTFSGMSIVGVLGSAGTIGQDMVMMRQLDEYRKAVREKSDEDLAFHIDELKRREVAPEIIEIAEKELQREDRGLAEEAVTEETMEEPVVEKGEEEIAQRPEVTEEEAVAETVKEPAVEEAVTEEAEVKEPAKKPVEEMTEEEIDKELEDFTAEEKEVTEEEIEAEPESKGRYVSERAKLAQGIKNTKTRMRMLTGQTKIGETVDEYDALKARLKGEEKVGKKALTAGKKAGIAQERARKTELITQARQKKAEKNYIRKLAKSVSKKVSVNTDFYYREAIEALQSGVDPNFRTKKTLESREATRKFLDKHPERTEDMPRKLLDMIQKKPLNEMTIKELEDLNEEITDLREKGKLKWELKENQKRRKTQQITRESQEIILRGKEVKPVPKGKLAGKEPITKKIPRGITAAAERPQMRFDRLDGGKATFDGFHHKYFYNNSNRVVVDGRAISDQRLKSGQDKLKLLGLKIKDLYKTREFDGNKFTVSECIGVYLAMQNPNSKAAILAEHGNALGEGLAERMIDSLTESEKKLGDWLVAEIDDNYDRMRESHIEQANEDPGKVPGVYFPMRHVDQDMSGGMKQEMLDEVAEREVLKKAYPGRGFTKARVTIPDKYQKPLDLDAFKIWTDHVQKVEHYIAAGEQVAEWQRVINDPDWKAAVRQEYGSEMVNWIQSWVNVVANPNIYQDMGNATGTLNKLRRGSRQIRRTLATAYLWAKLPTMVKQLPSGAFYWPYSGFARHAAAGLKFLANPGKMVREVNAMDLEMKHRSIDRFQAELRAASPEAYSRILSKVGEAGMAGIWLMDKITTTIGWQACYDRAIAPKNRGGLEMSHAEAIEYARNVTLRTQPAAHAKDLAEMYRSDEFLNMFLQFSNQLNQNWNMATYTLPRTIRSIFDKESKGQRLSKAREALVIPMAMAVVGTTMWCVSHRDVPDEPEDLLDGFSEFGVAMIPGIGKSVQSVAEGFDVGSLPIMQSVEKVIQSITGKKSPKQRLDKAIDGLSPMVGFPYSGLEKIYKTIEEGDPMELLGGAPKKRTFVR